MQPELQVLPVVEAAGCDPGWSLLSPVLTRRCLVLLPGQGSEVGGTRGVPRAAEPRPKKTSRGALHSASLRPMKCMCPGRRGMRTTALAGGSLY